MFAASENHSINDDLFEQFPRRDLPVAIITSDLLILWFPLFLL